MHRVSELLVKEERKPPQSKVILLVTELNILMAWIY